MKKITLLKFFYSDFLYGFNCFILFLNVSSRQTTKQYSNQGRNIK